MTGVNAWCQCGLRLALMTRKNLLRMSFRLLAGLLLAQGLAAAPGPLERWWLSPDVALATAGGLVVDHGVAEERGLGVSALLPIPLPERADLMAIDHGVAGELLFCTDVPIAIPGGVSRRADVLAWNGSTISRAFDSTAAGIPAAVGCHAVARAPGGLLIAFDVSVDLPPLVRSSDIALWNGSGFSVAFTGSAVGLPAKARIDALTRSPDGRLWMSFAEGGKVAGITYADEDVLAFDPASSGWSMVRRLAQDSPRWHAANLDALSVVFLSDAIFANGFE